METKPVRPRLSEDDAWAIATAWQPHIQGRVRLEIDRDGPVPAIHESYAWVRLDEPRALGCTNENDANHRREVVSVMRAVMVTWSALAACPGFSSDDNSEFWKRVITEIQEDREPRPSPRGCAMGHRDTPSSITDACGFFDQLGHTFPRFMVATPYTLDEHFMRLFTAEGPDLVPEVSEKLNSVLAHLHAFRHETTGTAFPSIDISLRMHSKYPFTTSDTMAFSDLLRATTSQTCTKSLRFRICQIDLNSPLHLHRKEHVDGFHALTKALPLRFADIHLSPIVNEVASNNRAKWLQSFLRIPGHDIRAEVTSFSVRRFEMNDAVFQALMSALPFATSVHTIRTDGDHSAFELKDLPWIAYAIFHPKTASSTWKHLKLTDLTLTEHCFHVLSAMARGNNLLALLNGSPPTCDAYYSAEVAPGTVVRVQPGKQLLKILTRSEPEALYVVSSTKSIEVDVCGIFSLARASWGKWVAVIVPAYGLG